jgi:hypothetical protein
MKVINVLIESIVIKSAINDKKINSDHKDLGVIGGL